MPKGTGPNSGADYTGLSSFGTDAAGEIYFCQMSSIGGRIYKLAARRPAAARAIRCRSCFRRPARSPTSPRSRPADGLIPYTVNSPLWSDGAVKSRWMALPTNTNIGFARDGEWTFPAGTVFVEKFRSARGRHESANPAPSGNPPARPRHQRLRLWRELQMARRQFRRRPRLRRHHRGYFHQDRRRHAHAEMVLSRPAGLPHLSHARVRRRARRQNPPDQRQFQISRRRHRQPASRLEPPRPLRPAAERARPAAFRPARRRHQHRRAAANFASAPISTPTAPSATGPAAPARSSTRASTRRSKSRISSTAPSPICLALPAPKSSSPAKPTNPFCSIASASPAGNKCRRSPKMSWTPTRVGVIARWIATLRTTAAVLPRGWFDAGHRQRRFRRRGELPQRPVQSHRVRRATSGKTPTRFISPPGRSSATGKSSRASAPCNSPIRGPRPA